MTICLIGLVISISLIWVQSSLRLEPVENEIETIDIAHSNVDVGARRARGNVVDRAWSSAPSSRRFSGEEFSEDSPLELLFCDAVTADAIALRKFQLLTPSTDQVIEEASTDSDGIAFVSLAKKDLPLVVQIDGYMPTNLCAVDNSTTNTVSLFRFGRFLGTVASADGAALPGCKITAHWAGITLGESRAGPQGKFVLDKFPMSVSIELEIVPPYGFIPISETTTLPYEMPHIERIFTVRRGVKLSAAVIFDNGEPAANHRLQLNHLGSARTGRPLVQTTDHEGMVNFDGVELGSVVFEVLRYGVTLRHLLNAQSDQTTPTLVIPPLRRVCVETNGEWRLNSYRIDWRTLPDGHWHTRYTKDGEHHLDCSAASNVSLQLKDDRFGVIARAEVGPNQTSIVFDLSHLSSVCIDRSDLSFRSMIQENEGPRRDWDIAQSKSSVSGVLPGNYRLEARDRTGRIFVWTNVSVPAGQLVTLNTEQAISTKRRKIVTVLYNKTPIPQAAVRIGGGTKSIVAGMTDTDGRLTLGKYHSGQKLWATAGKLSSETVLLDDLLSDEVELHLAIQSGVAGRVVLPSKWKRSVATLMTVGPSSISSSTAIDLDGSFDFSAAQPLPSNARRRLVVGRVRKEVKDHEELYFDAPDVLGSFNLSKWLDRQSLSGAAVIFDTGWVVQPKLNGTVIEFPAPYNAQGWIIAARSGDKGTTTVFLKFLGNKCQECRGNVALRSNSKSSDAKISISHIGDIDIKAAIGFQPVITLLLDDQSGRWVGKGLPMDSVAEFRVGSTRRRIRIDLGASLR